MVGIALKVISVAAFLAMSAFLKGADGIPSGQLVFYRSIFALIPIVAFLAWRRELIDGMKTAHPLSHLGRGLVGALGMSLGFFALTRLPLPEAVAIGYATPLLIVVMSAVFLREHVRLYRWSAVLIGLVGVAIMISPRISLFSGGPGLTGGASLGAIASLAGCVVGASAALLVRRMVQTERSATIVFYFSITCSVVALLTIPFGWVWPTPQQAALLIAAGIAGGIGQVTLTESYRYADMSVIAPFEYVSLVFSIIVGNIFFGDVPTTEMLIGSVIVVAAGIFIIYREHRLGLERKRARRVTPPQG